jgi:predicted acetyltransferase
MSDYVVRALEPDEFRAANALFRGTLHFSPISDADWQIAERASTLSRPIGAFRDDVIVGTARSAASMLVVPGGAQVPMAMITAVGVRADHTRRGVLTAMMRAQLTGTSEPIATLRASEAVIYGRFGYGVATRGRTVTINRRRAVPHPAAPGGGVVRVVPFAESASIIRPLFERIAPRRPGMLRRPESWWAMQPLWATWNDGVTLILAVHSGPEGDDGFAVYSVDRSNHDKRVLRVEDLWAASSDAWAGLWRFLVGVDLVDEIEAELRPLDEPVELLFADRRAVTVPTVMDETWLRLVDVPDALAARQFGAEQVVVDVRDAFLPHNSGRYRLGGAAPAARTDEPADLVIEVDALGALYLGDVSPSALASVGRVVAVGARDDALARADRVFASAQVPWCGTFF